MNKKYIGAISMDINTKALNYGSWLHSFAFQTFINKTNNNVVCEIIDYKRPDQENYNIKYPFFYYFRTRNYKEFLKYFIFYKRHLTRYSKFQNFKENKMVVSDSSYTISSLSKAKLKYDVLVCDSDTIWTPRSHGKYDEAYFLSLPSMVSIPKIAYSPSMGNGQIPNELGSVLKQYLSSFSFISCRESYEKEILKRYTNKDVVQVLDPVFLLSKEDYYFLINKPYKNKKKYVLIYQPIDRNEWLYKKAIEYATLNSFSIIEISTRVLQRMNKGITIDYKAGPIDFLAAIKYAQCVFTNSFHAICFSIIFETQFYAFGRKDNLKVLDICNRFGLSNRYINDNCPLCEETIDYIGVTKLSEQLSTFSKKWLLNSISRCFKERDKNG